MILFLLLKAYQPGLFDEQVTVTGHATKKGTYVQPYQAKRKKRLKDVVEGDMFAEPEPTKKEPWQMTLAEFRKHHPATQRFTKYDSDFAGLRSRKSGYVRQHAFGETWFHHPMGENTAHDTNGKATKHAHKTVIKKAIAEGKAVPADVLADYPDLKPKEPEKKPEPAKGEATDQKRIDMVAKRFGLTAAEVSDAIKARPEDLSERDEWYPSNKTDAPAEFKKYPIGTAQLDRYGAIENRYINFLREFDASELTTAEAEDGIKQHHTYQKYVQWAKEGKEPPYIFVAQTDSGKLQSTNRRRVLAAQEAGTKIKGWFGPMNKETGLPLKYGDIIRAYQEPAKGEATGLFSESDAPTPPKPPKPKKEPTPEQTQRQAEKKAEKEEDKAVAAAYRKAKEIAGKAGEMSVRGALGGQDSKAIGTLAHDGDTYRVSLVRNSGAGMVSVAITPKGEKRATITSVRDDQTLAHAMGALLAAVKPEAVLTLDNQDAIAAQKATAQQARQQKEADAAIKAMRKYRASLGGSADPQPWDETDLKLHAKITKTESYKYKSAHDERILEINKARLKSDPSQWEAGHGVAWKVGRDQTNHGFRVKRIDAASKTALITQVADTGLTTSGGNYDRMKDEWVDIADLRRERKYDAPTTTPPEKAAKGADKLDPGIDEHALKRLEKEAVDAKASVESERAALERLHASDNIPGVFQAGGSNYTMGKKREAMNSRLSTQFNKLQDAEQRLKNAESRLSGYRSGEYHENGQAKANSPKREAVKAATKTYADFIRATVKAGDRVTFLPNPSPGGDTIKKLNQKTVSLSGGSSWDYLDIHPWIDGNPATQKEVMAAFKRWKENADSETTTKSFPMLRLFAKSATIAEPADELIREHARLVKVLRSPSHADDLKESDEQERELKEYRKKRKRMKKALLVAPLTALLKARAHG